MVIDCSTHDPFVVGVVEGFLGFAFDLGPAIQVRLFGEDGDIGQIGADSAISSSPALAH